MPRFFRHRESTSVKLDMFFSLKEFHSFKEAFIGDANILYDLIGSATNADNENCHTELAVLLLHELLEMVSDLINKDDYFASMFHLVTSQLGALTR